MSDPNLDNVGPVNDPTPPAEAGSEPSSEGSSSELEQVRRQLSASSREAKRLKEELDNLKAERLRLELYLKNMKPPEPQQPAVESKDVDDIDAEELYSGVLKEDKNKIRNVLVKVSEAAEQRALRKLYGMAAESQEIQSSVAYLGSIPELKDPNSALSKVAWQEYVEIINNPMELAGIKPAQISLGGYSINPHAMKLAVLKAKSKVGAETSSRDAARAISDSHVVDGSEGKFSAADEKPSFNPMVHLSAEERAYVNSLRSRGEKGYTYEHYWKMLEKAHPGIQEARLKAGGPVKKA